MRYDDFRELGGLVRHDANVRRAKEQRRATECGGKMKYAGFNEAKRAIHNTTAGDVKPFRCHQCSAWHLGKDRSREKRIHMLRAL